MAINLPQFSEDMDIIQKLGDTPGTDNNLDWKQLQAKFDEAGNLLKTYLNTIIPLLNAAFSNEGSVITGGTLIGDLDINGNRLFGIGEPTADSDAANKGYVDTAEANAKNASLPKAGGTMAGIIDMAWNRITNVPVPIADTDAVGKSYVDERIVTYQNVSVPASAWHSGGTIGGAMRPIYADVTLSNVTSNMYVSVAFKQDDIEAYNFAATCYVSDGFIEIYAETAPTVAITIPAIICLKV